MLYSTFYYNLFYSESLISKLFINESRDTVCGETLVHQDHCEIIKFRLSAYLTYGMPLLNDVIYQYIRDFVFYINFYARHQYFSIPMCM